MLEMHLNLISFFSCCHITFYRDRVMQCEASYLIMNEILTSIRAGKTSKAYSQNAQLPVRTGDKASDSGVAGSLQKGGREHHIQVHKAVQDSNRASYSS